MELFAFDDDYVRRLRAREERTERHFVSYFTSLLGAKLRGKVPPDAVDDVRQEVFLRVLAVVGRGELREGARLGPYVNTVCNNVVFERYRKEGRTEPLAEKFDVEGDSDTERRAEESEIRKRVHETLAELSERDTRLLRALFLDERDKDEVCREFGVERSYLRVLLHRAKEQFRGKFGPDGFFFSRR